MDAIVARAIGTAFERIGAKLALALDSRRLRELLDEGMFQSSADKFERLIRELSPEDAARLQKFLASSQFAIIFQRFGIAALADPAGSDREKMKIRNELGEAVKLWLRRPALDRLTIAVSGALQEYCTTAASHLVGTSVTPRKAVGSPSSTIALMPAALDYISAGNRNAVLLSRIDNLAEIFDFAVACRKTAARLNSHIQLTHWYGRRFVELDDIYIEPRVYDDTAFHASVGDRERQIAGITLTSVLQENQRVVLLGDPGGGKSTAAQNLCLKLARRRTDTDLVPTVPFLIAVREFSDELTSKTRTLLSLLEDFCRMKLNIEPPPGAIKYLLLNGGAHLIFDGLDELLDPPAREAVSASLTSFVCNYPDVPILVTSRRIGYNEAPLRPNEFAVTILGDFSDESVAQYVSKWFRFDEQTPEGEREILAQAFIGESVITGELRNNALMLGLMCSLYSTEGYIPKNTPELYEKCSTMLFERWDAKRGIVVKIPFTSLLRAALNALALDLYLRPTRSDHFGLSPSRQVVLGKFKKLGSEWNIEWSDESPTEFDGAYTGRRIVRFLREFLLNYRFEYPDEAEDAAKRFLDFCTGRAWVLTNTGSSRTEEIFAFTHRTFLEYFAACQLVSMSSSVEEIAACIQSLLEFDRSNVVAQMVLQLYGSRSADSASSAISILLKLESVGSSGTAGSQIALAEFLARALSRTVPKPSVTREVVRQVWDASAFKSGSEWPPHLTIGHLLGASLENLPTIVREFEEISMVGLNSDTIFADRRLCAVAYPLECASSYAIHLTQEHIETLSELGKRLRRRMATNLRNYGPPAKWPPWLRVFGALRGSSPTAKTLEGTTSVLIAPYVDGVSTPIGLGLIAALAGNESPRRDLHDPEVRLSNEFCLRLALGIARAEPFDIRGSIEYLREIDIASLSRPVPRAENPLRLALYFALMTLLIDILLPEETMKPRSFDRVREWSRLVDPIINFEQLRGIPSVREVHVYLEEWISGERPRVVRVESETRQYL